MGKTIVEKIFSNKSNTDAHAGDYVVADIDFSFAHSASAILVTDIFKEMGGKNIPNPAKVALINGQQPDCPTAQVANKQKAFRDFSQEHAVHFHEVGEGICHNLITDNGYVTPGDLVVGADSHTCTYGALNVLSTGIGSSDMACVLLSGKMWFKVPESIKIVLNGKLPKGVYSKDLILYIIKMIKNEDTIYKAIEFTGTAVSAMSMDARFTMCNMAVEIGAKAALMDVDKITSDWLKRHTKRDYTPAYADKDAIYEKTIELDVSKLVPQIAKPHYVDNVVPVTEIGNVPVNIALLCSCTNGRLEDLRIGAEIIKEKKIAKSVRLYITPASQFVYSQAMKEGILEIFVDSGAMISIPGCNGCGNYFACPGDGENVISSANRNFKGRKGNNKGSIYLASPATVVASAIAGKIVDCRQYIGEAL